MDRLSQSSVILFFLLAGFLIYITQSGSLPTYLNLLFGRVTPQASAGVQAASNPNGVPVSSTIASIFQGGQAQAGSTLGTATSTFTGWLKSLGLF